MIIQAAKGGDVTPPELIVNSTMTTSNNASTDTSGDRGGVVGMRMSYSSGNSCYKCIFMVLSRIILPKR